MNEWGIYIVLYCVLLYAKALYNHMCGGRGGSLLNHHQCAASTWMIRWLPQQLFGFPPSSNIFKTDVNVCGAVQYIDTMEPELQLIECVL